MMEILKLNGGKKKSQHFQVKTFWPGEERTEERWMSDNIIIIIIVFFFRALSLDIVASHYFILLYVLFMFM